MADYTPDDEAETLQALGLSGQPASSQQSAPPQPSADEAETLRLLNISHPVKTDESGNVPKTRITVRPPSVIPGADALRGYTEQAMQGMPIVSPLLDKTTAAVGALLTPLLSSDAAPTYGQRYADELARIQGENQQFATQHPIGSTIANILGGTAAMAPLGGAGAAPTVLNAAGIPAAPIGARIGGAILGTEGPSLGMRALTAGIGQGGIGATDSALRGDNPLIGGGIGFTGGFGGTLAGDLAHKATGAALNYFAPPTGPLQGLHPVTVNKLTGAMEGENPATIAAAQARIGPAGMLGDLTQGTTSIARALADESGPSKALVRNAYQMRADQQGARIETALDRTMGPARNLVADTNMLTEARAQAADPLYRQFRTTPVPPTQELKDLLPRIEAAGGFDEAEKLSAIRGTPLTKNYFTPGKQKSYPTTEAWDLVKRGLDSKIEQAYAAGNKTRGSSLVGLKNELLAAIEKSPAGAIYKQARGAFTERSQLIDQLHAGTDTFLGGRSGLSVDELREELKGLSRPERLMRQAGLRAAAKEALGSTVNGDTSLRNKMLAPNNQEKIRLIMGDKARADDLIAMLKQEKYLGDKTQAVIGGSQTAGNLGNRDMLKAPTVPPWELDVTKPGTWFPPSWRDQFTYAGMRNASIGANYERAKNELAHLITRPNGPSLNNLVDAIGNEAARRGARASRLVAGGNALGALLAQPGSSAARRNLPAQ